jgi:hypothetical protein
MSSPDIPSPLLLKESALPVPSVVAGEDVPMTAGQRIYKTATYLSVDWVWNAACGVWFSDFMNYHSKGGEKLSLLWEKGLSTVIKNDAALASSVKNACTFTNIIMGGMMTIPPLLILEKPHVKQAAAEWLDRRIYGDKAVENDPYFHAAYQQMAHEPKKDFTIGMIARGAALAPLLGLVIEEHSKQVLQDKVFQPFTDESKYLANKTFLNKELVANTMSKDMQGSAVLVQERWNNLHDSLAMDLSFGLPYAAMHSFWYDRIAGWMAPKEKPSVDASEAISMPTTRIHEGASALSEKGVATSHAGEEISVAGR